MGKSADMSFVISITGFGAQTINLGLITLIVFMIGITAEMLNTLLSFKITDE